MTPNRPQAIQAGRTVPYEVYEKVKQERDQARWERDQEHAEVLFYRQLDKVPAKVMSPAQKTAWRTIRAAYKEGTPDDRGWVQIIPAKCAEQAGMSKGTLLDHASYCVSALGILHKRVIEIRDTNTQAIIRKDYYIALDDSAEYPLDYRAEKAREHGGLRCSCGSTNLHRRVIVTCRDCGTVVSDSDKDKKPAKPPVVPTEQVDYKAFGAIVEGSLAPENEKSHDGESTILPHPLLCDEFPIMAQPASETGSPAFRALKRSIREDLARWRAEEEQNNGK